MSRPVGLVVHRVRQTFAFKNGPALLWQIATRPLPGASTELRFELRNGLRMAIPNYPGARVPIYEIFVEDAYRIGDLTAGLSPEPAVLDIGGHVGSFSIALAHALPQARVTTYEASPVTVEWTRKNVAANNLRDVVKVNHCAVSASSGVLVFADNGHGSGLNGLTSPQSVQQHEVPCVTLEEAINEAETRLGRDVELIKIDTEGAEYDILLSADPAVLKRVRAVVMEHHDVPGHHVNELIKHLAEAGLVLVRREGEDRIGALWFTRLES